MDQKSVLCHLCGEETERFDDHLARVHQLRDRSKKETVPVLPGKTTGTMGCETCGKNFKVRRALAVHQTVMHREVFADVDAAVDKNIKRSPEPSTSATPEDFRSTGVDMRPTPNVVSDKCEPNFKSNRILACHLAQLHPGTTGDPSQSSQSGDIDQKTTSVATRSSCMKAMSGRQTTSVSRKSGLFGLRTTIH